MGSSVDVRRLGVGTGVGGGRLGEHRDGIGVPGKRTWTRETVAGGEQAAEAVQGLAVLVVLAVGLGRGVPGALGGARRGYLAGIDAVTVCGDSFGCKVVMPL